MKAKLIFDLNEEQEEFMDAVNGREWHKVVCKTINTLRDVYKHSKRSQEIKDFAENIENEIHDLMTGEGLVL